MSPTIANARREGAAAVKDAARARAAAHALRRGGLYAAARLDRGAISHRVILQAIRRAIPRRFDPAAARDLEATFELRIRDPRGGEPAPFELLVSGARCRVRPGPATRPGAVAAVGADDLIRLLSGAVGWPELLCSGRLELTGDPFLGLRFPALFRLPAGRVTP